MLDHSGRGTKVAGAVLDRHRSCPCRVLPARTTSVGRRAGRRWSWRGCGLIAVSSSTSADACAAALSTAISLPSSAFFLGDLIYHESLNPIREAIVGQRDDPEQFMVERLLDRSTGYVPMHVVGLSKPAPYLVMRVQIFGPLVWQMHLLRVRADRLTPVGIDVKERSVVPAAPRARKLRTRAGIAAYDSSSRSMNSV